MAGDFKEILGIIQAYETHLESLVEASMREWPTYPQLTASEKAFGQYLTEFISDLSVISQECMAAAIKLLQIRSLIKNTERKHPSHEEAKPYTKPLLESLERIKDYRVVLEERKKLLVTQCDMLRSMESHRAQFERAGGHPLKLQ